MQASQRPSVALLGIFQRGGGCFDVDRGGGGGVRAPSRGGAVLAYAGITPKTAENDEK